MGNQVATAYVAVVPSTQGFGRALAGEAGPEVKQSGAKMGGMLGDAFKLALVAAAVGAAALIGAELVKGIKGATDEAESLNKVGVVFGKNSKAVVDFANQGAKALGMSKASALEYTGTLGNLLTSTGLSTAKTSKMSTSMVKLAADMASFNNSTPEEALEALRAGLSGEAEPLKRFGVNLNDAQLKAEALAMGIADGKKQLTPAQKAQASYALIMKQTATAQGDFARTSGGVANQQKIMAAQWTDIRNRIGAGFLPMINNAQAGIIGLLDSVAAKGGLGALIPPEQQAQLAQLKTAFGDFLTSMKPAFEAIKGTIAQVSATLVPEVKKWAQEIIPTLTAFVGLMKKAWAALAPIVVPIIQFLVRVIGAALGLIVSIMRAVMMVVRGDWKGAWNLIKSGVSDAWRAIVSAVKTLASQLAPILKAAMSKAYDAAKSFVGRFPAIGRAIADGIKQGIHNAWDALIAKLRGLVSLLPDIVKRMLGINSPSRVFAEIGANITAGLAGGIAGGAGSVIRTTEAMVARAASVGGVSAPAYGAATGGSTINITGSRFDAQMIANQVGATLSMLNRPVPSMG